MQWWEVNRYLAGMRRRYRPEWETTRRLEWTLACMFWDKKNGAPPHDPQAFYKFPWEKAEDDAPAITDEEKAEAQEMMRNFTW